MAQLFIESRAKGSQPIIEQTERRAVKVLENSAESGVFRFEAVVSEADFVNQNRRKYPMEVLWPAFERMQLKIEQHPGLIDHPDFFSPGSVTDAGIMWEEFWKEGNLIYGRGRIIPTEKGKALQAVIEAGVLIGFSTRGYGESEEQTEDGRTIEVMVKYDFKNDGSVDAVLNPSVRHARVRNYRKEDIDTMDEELQKAIEAKGVAENKLVEANTALEAANGKITTLEGSVADLTAQLEAANAKIAELTEKVAEIEAAEAANILTAKLNELVEGHPFAAAIIAEARELGVTVENAERLIPRLKTLVESAAARGNEQGEPRGEIRTNEDTDPTDNDGLTDEQREELAGTGLI